MDINILNKYYDEGWLRKEEHTKLPLIIWTYSRKTEYEGYWNEVTLKCRGLVTDLEGNEINNPIPKFFNYDYHRADIPDFTKPFNSYKKLDGSMIMIFKYKKEIVICTKGSFISEQKYQARDIFKEQDKILDNHTYIFELIGRNNKVVCNYDFDLKLVLLAVRDKNGELSLHDFNFENVVEKVKLDVKNYEGFHKLSEMNIDNEEGYIIEQNQKRVKIKFFEYFRLHKIITSTSNIDIWFGLQNRLYLNQIIENIPDEFLDNVKLEINNIMTDYKNIESEVNNVIKVLYDKYLIDFVKGKTIILSKKKSAEIIRGHEYESIIFAKLNEKNYSKLIFREIRPEYRLI